MQNLRMIVIVAMVVVAAAATVALAFAMVSIGAPEWQAALGPILLVAIIAVRWFEARHVAAAKDAAKTD